MVHPQINSKEQELLQIEVNSQRIIPFTPEQFKKDKSEKDKIKEMKKLLKNENPR